VAYGSVKPVIRFGSRGKPKPKPNTEIGKTRNRSRTEKLTFQFGFGSVRFGFRSSVKKCPALAIANRLEKQGDPGCPTIPCSVGSFKFEKALCDLGASVSIMARDVFEKLLLPELEPTTMCLELGDKSIRYPLGIAVDVPVKVGHHFIRVDFVVLEMGETTTHLWEAFSQDRGSYHRCRQ
jgi:hypothetical protein